MQSTSISYDLAQDSRLPMSTLRSTASPYKRIQDPSLFKTYLSQLDRCQLMLPFDLENKPFPSPLTRALSDNSSGYVLSSISPKSASSQKFSKSSHLYRYFITENAILEPENASTLSPEHCSQSLASGSPLVPSSPISSVFAADISSYTDSCIADFPDDLSDPPNNLTSSFSGGEGDNDDAATESDYFIEPIVPFNSSFASSSQSPFSSPLSSVPSSPIMIREKTTLPEPNIRKPVPETSKHGIEGLCQLKGSRNRKRSRSPSPIPQRSRKARIKKHHNSGTNGLAATEETDEKRGERHSSSQISPIPFSQQSQRSSEELIGPLAQILAFSTKSSLTTSNVIHELLASLPSLRNERTVDQWTTLIVTIMSTNGVFGRAESNGVKVSVAYYETPHLLISCPRTPIMKRSRMNGFTVPKMTRMTFEGDFFPNFNEGVAKGGSHNRRSSITGSPSDSFGCNSRIDSGCIRVGY